jgi:antitoxin component of MazEF toxin-antitoxin module
MTTTLEADHKLTLPAEAVAQGHLEEGMELSVNVTSAGAVILRPKRQHKMSLLEHLRGMAGLEIPRDREMLGDPIEL